MDSYNNAHEKAERAWRTEIRELKLSYITIRSGVRILGNQFTLDVKQTLLGKLKRMTGSSAVPLGAEKWQMPYTVCTACIIVVTHNVVMT